MNDETGSSHWQIGENRCMIIASLCQEDDSKHMKGWGWSCRNIERSILYRGGQRHLEMHTVDCLPLPLPLTCREGPGQRYCDEDMNVAFQSGPCCCRMIWCYADICLGDDCWNKNLYLYINPSNNEFSWVLSWR